MYLFVRDDITPSQQIVQTCHAVDAINVRHNSGDINHMVLCHANHDAHLMSIAEYLDGKGIDYEMFQEPDLDNQYTAIATRPLRGQEREPMRKFKLKK
jgi:hypothetical protein